MNYYTLALFREPSVLFSILVFVPLIAAAGWQDEPGKSTQDKQEMAEQVSVQATRQTSPSNISLPDLIHDSSDHFSDIESANLDGLLERIGDSRLVLLGEATHGTAEFYDMRARISKELIEKKGFNIIAVEADWPDATSINYFIAGTTDKPVVKEKPFTGFPSWMWANESVLAFTHWLKDYNQRLDSDEHTVGFYGLDLYNLFGSIESVLNYLQDVNPEMAEVARTHYACLIPWANDPSEYSHVMQTHRNRGCRYEVYTVLRYLLNNRAHYMQSGRQRYFNAVQNARLVRNGERYYRTMYDSNSSDSWNQRDQNMFKTLQAILNYRGKSSKAVVWAHNSHIGDARATEMKDHDQFNLGQRVRESFGDSAYLIGFGTDHGTVAAASRWGGPMKVMQVQPSHKDSYEHLFHDVKTDNFLLPLGKNNRRNTISHNPQQDTARNRLLKKRPQRAIGTTYDPNDELKKHYSYASLPQQFDEYIWFDETRAVKPLQSDRQPIKRKQQNKYQLRLLTTNN